MSFSTVTSGLSDLFNTAGSIFNYGYNKWLQREQWEREDTAIQRRVADLEKAGLSKTLAGSGASSSIVTSSAPQVSNSMASAYLDELRLEKDNEVKDAQISNLKSDSDIKKKQLSLMKSQIASQILDNYTKSIQARLLSGQAEYLYSAGINDAQSKYYDSLSSLNNSLLNYDLVNFAHDNFMDPTAPSTRDAFLIDLSKKNGNTGSYLWNTARGVGNLLNRSLSFVGAFKK